MVQRPSGLGVNEGRLAQCPTTPNCINSQSDDPDYSMDPIPFNVPADQTIPLITSFLNSLPRVEVIEISNLYVAAVFRSKLIGYPDDVEFLMDQDKKLIHFRSASRIGVSDLGVNRKRMSQLTQDLYPIINPATTTE
ncbi:DUF1499 domain-containing protein [Verrucomicrobia bacterium]|nr:DUF1499 domain-containing protein [Verrucomicrobiota bacterium]